MGEDLRRLKVDARALLDALTARDVAVLGSYLDLRTGRVFQLLDPVLTGDDNEAIEAAMDQEPKRYARIPPFDREYRLMCAFAEELEDEALANALDQALRGRAAFRDFHALLERAPGTAAEWKNYRHEALVRWAIAWLNTLGIEPEGDLPEAPPPLPPREIDLLHLLLLGHGAPGLSEAGTIRRTLHAGSEAEARRLLVRFARQLCDSRGEPWQSRYVRGLDRFERDGFRLLRIGDRIEFEVVMAPEVLARFGITLPASRTPNTAEDG